MRVFDVITENKKIDEAPAGALSQMSRRLGAKALGAIGFKGKAAELTGKADVGAEANKLKTDLRGYLGKTGGNPKQIQGPQLAAFLKSKGYPNMHLKGVQGVMTPQQVDQAVLKAAQDAAAADGDPTKGAAPASTVPRPGASQPTGTAGQVQKGQSVMFDTSVGGVIQGSVLSSDGKTVKVKGGSQGKTYSVPIDQLKDPRTGELMQQAASSSATPTASAPASQSAPAGTAMPGIPPALLKRITSLTAQEKKQLAGMLQ